MYDQDRHQGRAKQRKMLSDMLQYFIAMWLQDGYKVSGHHNKPKISAQTITSN